jgi:DNA gyrase subunit A
LKDLSDIQARAIVEMRLRQLTGLEQELRAEYDEIMKLIDYLKGLLADVNLRIALIKENLLKFVRNTEMNVVL